MLLSTLAVLLYMKGFMNEYGVFTPYLFLVIFIYILSRIRLQGFLFKKSSEVTIPIWIRQGLTKENKRNGFIHLFVSLSFFVISWFYDLTLLIYLGWWAMGMSFATFSFGILHYFFPTSKIVSKVTKGKLGKNDIAIIAMVFFFIFIDYAQFIWPTYAEDPRPDGEGRIRVIFYLTGMAFFTTMNPLIILKLSRHRINVISVILLISFSLLQAFKFLNLLFSKGNLDREGFAFSFIIACAFTLFVLDAINDSGRGD